jgi:hypothetical protein
MIKKTKAIQKLAQHEVNLQKSLPHVHTQMELTTKATKTHLGSDFWNPQKNGKPMQKEFKADSKKP